MTRDQLEAVVRQELTAIWNNALVMAASGEGMGLTARANLATDYILEAADRYRGSGISAEAAALHAARTDIGRQPTYGQKAATR